MWLVLPESREVVVLDRHGELRLAAGQQLPAAEELPGLTPDVDRFFSQLR